MNWYLLVCLFVRVCVCECVCAVAMVSVRLSRLKLQIRKLLSFNRQLVAIRPPSNNTHTHTHTSLTTLNKHIVHIFQPSLHTCALFLHTSDMIHHLGVLYVQHTCFPEIFGIADWKTTLLNFYLAAVQP